MTFLWFSRKNAESRDPRPNVPTVRAKRTAAATGDGITPMESPFKSKDGGIEARWMAQESCTLKMEPSRSMAFSKRASHGPCVLNYSDGSKKFEGVFRYGYMHEGSVYRRGNVLAYQGRLKRSAAGYFRRTIQLLENDADDEFPILEMFLASPTTNVVLRHTRRTRRQTMASQSPSPFFRFLLKTKTSGHADPSQAACSDASGLSESNEPRPHTATAPIVATGYGLRLRTLAIRMPTLARTRLGRVHERRSAVHLLPAGTERRVVRVRGMRTSDTLRPMCRDDRA